MATPNKTQADSAAPSGHDTSEWDKGFRGVEVDKTPNEAYTVAGVTSSTTAAEADNAAEEGDAPTTDSDGDKG